MKQMKRIVQGLMIGALVFSFLSFLPTGSLYAQDSKEQTPELTEQELQQFQDLYNSPESDSSSLENLGGGSDYSDYTSGSSLPLGGGMEAIGSLLGAGGGAPSGLLLMGLLYAFGDYWWIPVVLYVLALLFIAFILFSSVFKRFKRFSREQAMVFGWNETKKHIWFFVLITLIQIIVYALLFIPIFSLFTTNPYIPIPEIKDTIPYAGYYVTALTIAVLFFFLLFVAGTTKISLKFIDGGRATVSDLFTAVAYLPKLVTAALLYLLIIVGPYIVLGVAAYYLKDTLNPLQLSIGTAVVGLLLAIPVSYWILKFYLYYLAVIDKGVWPIKALKFASQYSKGAKTDITLFLVLMFAVNWVGSAVPLMLGLFMAAPITSLAFTHAYRQLEKASSQQ